MPVGYDDCTAQASMVADAKSNVLLRDDPNVAQLNGASLVRLAPMYVRIRW